MISLLFVGVMGAACSDDTDVDAGGTSGDMKADGAAADSFIKKLPADYKPYPCTVVGRSCNAHDPCAFNPICGSDKLCWPEYLMDCNDSLDCTVDKCAGLGICTNLPKAGWCRVMYKTGVDDGGVSTTAPKCVKTGTKKPDDPCWGCNPTDGDGGATNNTKWMPISGGTCDDSNLCTKSDTCYNGTCKGTSFASLCSDGYGCTEDLCDGKGGCLGNKMKSNMCLINGVCYLDGGKKVDGSCNECDPTKSQSTWTPITSTCTIDSKCYNDGDYNGGKCATCDVKASTSKWTVKGSFCLINNICKKPGDKDSIACSTCDPTKNKYAWSQIAGLCKINGKCYTKGAKHPLGCAECDPTNSTSSWTVKGNYCLISNKCFNPKTKDSIACAECDPTKSMYAWTPIAGLCKISGTCFKSGDVHSGKCATCDPTKSTTAWTVKSTVSECLINNVCKKLGDKDMTGCATCAPTSSKYAWTATAGLCKIDGKCFASATAHPKGCATCAPASSTAAWTPKTGYCVIDQQCIATGAKDKTGCGVCDPTKSKTSWTVSSGKSCIVGPNKCVASGAKEPGGCGVCTPSSNANGWSMGSSCDVAHAWSWGFGGTSSDYAYRTAVDAGGNVYVTGYFYNSVTFGSTTHTTKGSADIYLASYSPSGQYRWSKTFGSTSYEYGYGVAVDPAGNVYLTGSFASSISFGGSTLSTSGGNDIFVAAFDTTGKHKWSTKLGSSSSDYGWAIGADSNSNVYVTGYFYSSMAVGSTTLYSKGSADIFLASFDSTGKPRWAKSFGNTSSDYGYGLAVDGGGNVYITGYFYNSVDFGGGAKTSVGSGDSYIAGFSPSGKYRWAHTYGSSSSDYGYDVATDSSGNVYAVGYFYNTMTVGGKTLTSNGGADIFVVGFTPSGTFRWAQGIGDSSYDYGYGVAADNAGNVYLAGNFSNTIKLSSSITATSSGGYDVLVASFNSTGTPLWVKTAGGTSSDYGRDVSVAPNGDVWAGGTFYNTVDFGGGSYTASSTDAFLMKLKQK